MNMKLMVILLIMVGLVGGGMFLSQLSLGKVGSSAATSDLTEHLEMGVTELNVSNLATMSDFYQRLVGLEILEQSDVSVTLGSQQRAIIRLVVTPKSSPAFGSAGLYHTAIVFTSRAVLAQTLERILTQDPERFSGSSDHLVSEAFYFSDPEGNGLELYFDKDPAGWQWQNGRVVMGSSYIDPQAYIDTYGHVSDDPSKKMGHVHLKVGSIEQAKAFYVDGLGLSITAETPGALFVSDGSYHHHLGLNTWESAGAGPRIQSLGLKSLELRVAAKKDLESLEKRLRTQDIEHTVTESSLTVTDPWGNQIVVTIFQ